MAIDRQAPPTSTDPFRHGVASFDPIADGVLLWTRVSRPDGGADPGAVVTWHIAEVGPRGATGAEVATGTTTVGDDTDGCVTADVTALQPATTYHYWFETSGSTSPIGRTRTLPAAGVAWARLAVTCCADPSMGPLWAYRAIAEDEVDLVLHLGDYIYEEPKGPYPVDPAGVSITLDDYRGRYGFTRLDPDLQAMHRRHPMVFVWDDHDTADNSWRHGAKAHDPDEHGDWETRLAAAARSRQEWLPARLQDPSDLLAMQRSFVLGDLLEVVVLDTRIPGRDLQSGDEGAKALDDPTRSLLGDDQRTWAHERVRDDTRRWCLLASQVTVSELTLPVPADAVLDPAMPSGYRVVDGRGICTDEWDGYPAERDALCDAIADRGPGVVVVSGDVHSNWATFLQGGRSEHPVAPEFVCTAVSSTAMGEQLPPGWQTIAQRVADAVPRERWHDLEHHGYIHVDVRPDVVRGDWYAIEPGADEYHVERLASWAVDRSWPPTSTPATPSSSTEAFTDVVRPGLPATSLPTTPSAATRAGIPPRPARRRAFKTTVALVAVAAAAAGVVLVRRRGWLRLGGGRRRR
jgi:alkaline phosphatase D